MVSTKTKERQTENYDQQDPPVAGKNLWKANFASALPHCIISLLKASVRKKTSRA